MRFILIWTLIFLASCSNFNGDDQNGHQLYSKGLTVDEVFFDQSAEMLASTWLLRSGQDFLSTSAQNNLKKFIGKWREIRSKIAEICGISLALSAEDKHAIQEIKLNEQLDNDEKKKHIKAILGQLLSARRKVIKGCKNHKANLLAPFGDLSSSLQSACLINFKSDEELAGAPTKKARAWQRVNTLTADEKARLNKRLESSECEAALAEKPESASLN